MMQRRCKSCGITVMKRRWELGYRKCMECGEQDAGLRVRTVAPAYNKGPYMLFTNLADLKTIHRKGG